MDIKKIIETYLDIIKNKYVCFNGTATQTELIYYIIVWVAGAFCFLVFVAFYFHSLVKELILHQD